MDEEFEDQVIQVRADTQAFQHDISEMQRSLADGLGGAADSAGRHIETALLRAVRTGKLGFDDLKRTALAVMNDIAQAAIQTGLDSLFQGSGKGGGSNGLLNLGTQLAAAFLGAPGRATGGPVAPGTAYRVGERGPELFVPSSSGRIETGTAHRPRDIRVTISVNAPQGREPEALTRSSRQIAHQVRRALASAE